MHDPNAPLDENPLPAIEFQSLGRFAVHNPNPPPQSRESISAAPFMLGQSTELLRFNSPQEARSHCLAFITQAQRSLSLYSQDFQPQLYNHSAIEQACIGFLLANHRHHLRILVADLGHSVRHGHRLLNLAKRLPSQCHIRKLNPNYSNPALNFLLADQHAMLLHPNPQLSDGYACYTAVGRVRQQQKSFEQSWDHSLIDPDLRSFLL